MEYTIGVFNLGEVEKGTITPIWKYPNKMRIYISYHKDIIHNMMN